MGLAKAPGTTLLRSMKLNRFGAPATGAGLPDPLNLICTGLPDASTGTMRLQVVTALVQSNTVNGKPVRTLNIPVKLQPVSACLAMPLVSLNKGISQL